MGGDHIGIPHQTLTDWQAFEGGRNNPTCSLKLPSGKRLRVAEITGNDGNTYSVVEISDWVEIARDVLKNPGKTRKATKDKLIDFLAWFAVKGFYAEAYTSLKGVYTAKDSRATSNWLNARNGGKLARNPYTDLLQACGVEGYDYGVWTNRVYVGLTGMTAKQMKAQWEKVDGCAIIARNYIPQAELLNAIAFCEKMVVAMFVDDLEEAHEGAIALTRRKFF